MQRFTAILGVVTLCAGIAAPAAAAEVYRWVGPDGVVHYSDEKPRDEAQYTTLQMDDSRPADYDPHKDPYSIQNQAKRINESWSAIAEARAEREQERVQYMQSAQNINTNEFQQGTQFRSRYYSPWFYSSIVPLNFQRRVNPGTAQRQAQAIEGLNLSVQRPASINSGVHRERVQRSSALPVSR